MTIALSALGLVAAIAGILNSRRLAAPRRKRILDDIALRDGVGHSGLEKRLQSLVAAETHRYVRQREAERHNTSRRVVAVRALAAGAYLTFLVVGIVSSPVNVYYLVLGPLGLAIFGSALANDARRWLRWRRDNPAPRRVP